MGEPAGQPCSECGLPPDVYVRPRPWWVRRVVVWQVVLMLAGAALLGWRWYSNWPAWNPPVTGGPNQHTNTQFPEGRLTAADLERIAAGEAEGVDLLSGLSIRRRHPHTEHIEISAQFGPATGRLTEFQHIGWPAAWLIHRYDSDVDDVYTRAGSKPAYSARPAGTRLWSDRRHVQYGEHRNRRHLRIIAPEAFGGVLLVALLGWSAGAMLRAVVSRRTQRFAGLRMVRVMPWVGLAAALVLVAALAPGAERITDRYQRPFGLDGHPTGLRYSEVGRSAADQARLARAILEAVGDERDGVLLLGNFVIPSFRQNSVASAPWPSISVSRITYDAPGAASRWWLQCEDGLTLWRSRVSDSQTEITVFGMRDTTAANLLLIAVLLWKLPLAARVALGRLLVLRSRRRGRRGVCLNCGYPRPRA